MSEELVTNAALAKARQVALDRAQRCRDNVARTVAWSAAQAEWSRARDIAMDIADGIEALRTRATDQETSNAE